MSKRIRIGTFYPEDLNLNGDQANLLVLLKRLEWRGVSAEIVAVKGTSKVNELDFLFLGHGSLAAWDSILKSDPKQLETAVSFMKSGKPLMAVASGYLKLLEQLGESYSIGKHRSEFVDVDGVVGYLNSPAEVEPVQWRESSLLTMLHGPLLAKNPELADRIIASQGWADTSIRNSDLEKVDALAAESRKIAFEH